MRVLLSIPILLGISLLGGPLVQGDETYVEGEILVQYRSVRDARAPARKGPGRSRMKRQYRRLSAALGGEVVLYASATDSTGALLEEIRKDPLVQRAQPNYRKSLLRSRFPNDAEFSNQWNLHNTGQSVNGSPGTVDADVDLPEARKLMKESVPEVVIAIMDSGVDYRHPDLREAMWVNTGEIPGNSVDDDVNGFVDDVYGYDFVGDLFEVRNVGLVNDGPDADPMDGDATDGHGTHLAGIAAAVADNSLGVSGLSEARIMALKISEDGASVSTSAVLDALDYVVLMKQRGVNIVVVNGSYGSGTYDILEHIAIDQLAGQGIVFCSSAGNSGTNNDVVPVYPAGYTSSHILAVASTDADDALAPTSNYGLTSVDLGAPGDAILSTYPSHVFPVSEIVHGGTSFEAQGFLFSGMSTGTTGTIVSCGLGTPLDIPFTVAGNVALIERGTLYFGEKVANAQAEGAVAAIIYNSAGETNVVTGNLGEPGGNIPAVGVSRSDGFALQLLAGQPVTVINRAHPLSAYQVFGGTSMAAPHVAGAVALLAQHYPHDTLAMRIQRIRAGVDLLPALVGDTSTGGRLNLAHLLDTDADDVPDWWELQYAPNLLSITDTTDGDGDGSLDQSEYRAGTDPTNATSFLAFRAGADQRSFSWPSATGRTYQVSTATRLDLPFNPLTAVLPATPPTNVWELIPVGSDTQRFYRVDLLWD